MVLDFKLISAELMNLQKVTIQRIGENPFQCITHYKLANKVEQFLYVEEVFVINSPKASFPVFCVLLERGGGSEGT